MGEFSRVEIDGHLMIVTIDRPEVHNACHPMANQELSDAFDAFLVDRFPGQANSLLWLADAHICLGKVPRQESLLPSCGGAPQQPLGAKIHLQRLGEVTTCLVDQADVH